MTFLHTIFLPALLAAAIPVLLHFFSRRRLPLIPFSSLEFLKRLQKRQSRRIQLRQIILLIIRTLAVIALVMVFSRPATQTAASVGSAASVEMVIILDDAITSTARSRDGELLRLAINRCSAILDVIQPGDGVTLIPLSNPSNLESVQAGQIMLLRERLDNAQSAYVSGNIFDAVHTADSILFASSRFNRELYIVSGFYDARWDSVITLKTPGIRLFLLPVGPEYLSNASVSTVNMRSTILQKGRMVELDATITNSSRAALKDAVVSVYLEGERVAQTSVDIPPGATGSALLNFTPESTGRLSGSVRIEDDDALMVDSRRYFILNIPENLRLLAVAENETDRKLLRAALSTESAGFVQLEFADINRWETKPLESFNALLLSGVGSVSPGAIERVAEFVEQGGGLIIFPSLNTDLALVSRGLWKRLGFGGAKGTISTSGITWGKFDLNHPLFTGMFEKGGAPRAPDLKFALDLATGSGNAIIIPLSNGSPFLLERPVNRGRALLFAIPLAPEAGDFIYTGIFAPLLFRSVGYSTAGEFDHLPKWQTGGRYRFTLPLERITEIQLIDPSGDLTVLPPRPTSGGVELESGYIQLPGIYDVRTDNRTISRFASNIPDDVGRLVRADVNRILKHHDHASILPDDPQKIQQNIYTARYGRELWQVAAAAFIGLLLAESIIARPRKREEEDSIR